MESAEDKVLTEAVEAIRRTVRVRKPTAKAMENNVFGGVDAWRVRQPTVSIARNANGDAPFDRCNCCLPTLGVLLKGHFTNTSAAHRNNAMAQSTCTTDTNLCPFVVEEVAHLTPFSDTTASAHTIESDRRIISKIKDLDPDTGDLFQLKQQLVIKPPFRLLLERQPVKAAAASSFIAVSYCWHHTSEWLPTPGCELGESRYFKGLPISDQCFKEVLGCRKPGEGIWVDQLCIVQEDEDEKQLAIALMDLIYKHARLIVIVIEDMTILESEAFVIKQLQDISSQSEMPDSFTKLLLENDLTVWDFISKIGNSRWFHRAWCTHEFHLCRNAVFIIPSEAQSRPICLKLGTLQRILQFKAYWVPTTRVPSNESLEGYRHVVLLLTSHYLLSKEHLLGMPVVGICYLINSLQASLFRDKVSIAVNLLDLGLYFCGAVSSEGHCRYIFMLLAFATGDPISLCCSGETLNNDGAEWMKMSLGLNCLQWPVASDLVHMGSRYPRTNQPLSKEIKFQNGGMIVDVFTLPRLDCKPSPESRKRSRNFFLSILDDPEILASMEPEEWANPMLDKKMLLENGVNYLACAIELGSDWISEALGSMGCSPTVTGLRADNWPGIANSLWHSARTHLITANTDDESPIRKPLVAFLTFALQHILLLGETAQNIATVKFSGSVAMRAMVSLPPGYRADEFLLAVPISLSEPENTFIKRLWLLKRRNEEQSVSDEYYIQSKGYIWGCGTLRLQLTPESTLGSTPDRADSGQSLDQKRRTLSCSSAPR